MSTMSIDSQELPYLNPEFIGIGKTLEAKKRQRRSLMEEERILESKVAFFEKEERKTSKSIDENRKMLERIMQIRQRREEERKQKKLQQYLTEQELNRLRLQSEFERRTHMSNKQDAMDRINRRNKNTFHTIKSKFQNDVSHQKQQMRNQRRKKYENYAWIENQKQSGKDKVNSFFKEKNAEAVESYKRKIQHQENIQNQVRDNMTSLELREHELVNRLQKSYLYKQKLQAAIDSAYDVQFHELETLLGRPQSLNSKQQSRATSTGFRTTRQSHLTGGSKLDRSPSPEYLPLAITMNNFHPKGSEQVSESLTKKKHKSKRKKIKYMEAD